MLHNSAEEQAFPTASPDFVLALHSVPGFENLLDYTPADSAVDSHPDYTPAVLSIRNNHPALPAAAEEAAVRLEEEGNISVADSDFGSDQVTPSY